MADVQNYLDDSEFFAEERIAAMKRHDVITFNNLPLNSFGYWHTDFNYCGNRICERLGSYNTGMTPEIARRKLAHLYEELALDLYAYVKKDRAGKDDYRKRNNISQAKKKDNNNE